MTTHLDTLRRRLAAAREDLRWALHLPHPYKGRQAQRLRTLEHKILELMGRIKALEEDK